MLNPIRLKAVGTPDALDELALMPLSPSCSGPVGSAADLVEQSLPESLTYRSIMRIWTFETLRAGDGLLKEDAH